MWTYNQNNYELYHHGIKGMRWGVRRYQNPDGTLTPAGKKRAAKADKRIERYETLRKKNASAYERANIMAEKRYKGSRNSKALAKKLAANKALYDSTEVNNKYSIARQKAKKDASYKDTDEYKQAKRDYKNQARNSQLLGYEGHLRTEQLKNLGKSEKKAKGQALTEALLKRPEVWMLTAAAVVAAVNAPKSIKKSYNKHMDSKYNTTVLDASGKVLKRYNQDLTYHPKLG